MNTKRLSDYKSSIDVDTIKRKRAQMTPAERREQMVSGVFGLLDSKSEVTKEEIREEIERIYRGGPD